jgi:hypothetical protein
MQNIAYNRKSRSSCKRHKHDAAKRKNLWVRGSGRFVRAGCGKRLTGAENSQGVNVWLDEDARRSVIEVFG